MNTDPAVLKKIKKLLSLAADPSNQHEAALAASKAQELLLKHKLDLTDIADADAARKQQLIFEEDLTFPKGIREVGNWKRILAATICRHHFCMLFTTPRGLRFIGAQEDLAIAAWMYGYLSGQLERLGDVGWQNRRAQLQVSPFGQEHLKNKRAGVTWKNNFYIGAIHVLSDRFEAMRKRIEEEAIQRRRDQNRRDAMNELRKGGASMSAIARRYESLEESRQRALAPFTEALARVQEFVNEKYNDGQIETPEGEIDFKEDIDGFTHGIVAGERISLNKPLTGTAGEKAKLQS